ncbi:sensor histidine kinase [Cohnella yongneupensis]|uniref:histidine kinase n=1 Tax=Cohnella yongneupensis TaxID=425006 RepID=A0ABW0QT86_9BACL
MKYRILHAKLFVITALFLVLLAAGLLYAQSLYFVEYYTNQKARQFESDERSVASKILLTNGSEIEMKDLINNLQKENPIEIALYPFEPGTPEDIKSIIKRLLVDGNGNIDSSSNEAAAQILQLLEWPTDISQWKNVQQMKMDMYGIQYLARYRTIQFDNGSTYLMVTTTSLQPVDEAVVTLRKSTIYIVLAAVGLSIVLSLLIARLVARPLIREIEQDKKTEAMRKQFLANASHELKTPISIISGYAESLADGIVTSEQEREEYAKTIQDEAGKMGKLVKDMLDLSLLQNGNVTLNKSEVSLDGVLLRTLNRLTPLAKRKEIDIEQAQIAACSFAANEAQLETVFSNLIGNAIHHTPVGKSISVRLTCTEPDIRFEIENEGEPIPQQMQARIWESFFRVDQARNREEGRYGLGLSIVKEIVENHKGVVGVHNTSKGVLFFVSFRRGR